MIRKIIISLILLMLIIPLSSAKTIDINVEENMIDRNFAYLNYNPDTFTTTYNDVLVTLNYNLKNPPFNSTNVRNVEIWHELQVYTDKGNSYTIEDVLVNHTVKWDFSFDTDGTWYSGSWCRPVVVITVTVDNVVKYNNHRSPIPTSLCFGSEVSTIIVRYSSVIQGNETVNSGFLLTGGAAVTYLDSNGLLDLATRNADVVGTSFVVGDYYTNFVSPNAYSNLYFSGPTDGARVQYRFVTNEGVEIFYQDICNQSDLNFFIRGACVIGDVMRAVGRTLVEGLGNLLTSILSAIGIDPEIQRAIFVSIKLTGFFAKTVLLFIILYPVQLWAIGMFLWFVVGIFMAVAEANFILPFLYIFNYVKGTIMMFFKLIAWVASKFKKSPSGS